jgi:hypothetical protein
LGEWRNLAHSYVELTKRAEDFQKLRSGDSEVRVALIKGSQPAHLDVANVLVSDDVDHLEFNGKPALDDANDNNFLPLGDSTSAADMIIALGEFKPHIVVLTGGMEFVNNVMLGLEGNWMDEAEVDGQVRPFYVLSPEIAAYSSLPNATLKQVPYADIIQRSAGINFAGYEDRTLYKMYRANFQTLYGAAAFIEEHENFYDAMYYLAYAVAAAGTPAGLDGDDLALGMKRITARGETSFNVGPNDIGKTLIALQQGDVNIKGTMGPSNFFPGTGIRELDGSVWCMKPEGALYNVLRIDPETRELTGDFTECIADF